MADKKGAGGDTDFRRTFNREGAAERGAERERKEREEGKARYEAKLEGKTYHRRASTPPDARETEARSERLDVASMIGKTMLVPGGAGQGKRGKSAGFYCVACDMTFKDNIQYVEHQNSKVHLIATGQTGIVQVASLEMVRNRLRWLTRKRKEEAMDEVIDIDTRLDMAKDREEQERAEKREKRNQKRRKQKDPVELAEAMIKKEQGVD